MEQTRLTEEERGDLSNIESFNAKLGKSDWLLSDRLVEEISLAGIELHGAGLENVHFNRIDMSGGALHSTRMTTVNFYGGSIRDSVFEGVEFTRCEFVDLDSENATFRKCVFRQGRAESWDAAGATFEDCVFEEFPANSLDLSDATIERTRFEQSEITGLGLYDARLKDVEFDRCKLNDATFSDLEVANLGFKGGAIVDSGFDGGTYDRIRFEGSDIIDVAFQSVGVRGLLVIDAETVDELTFDTCELENPVLSGCKTSKELMFIESKIDNIELKDSLHYFLDMAGCTVTGTNLFKGLTISGAKFTKSKIEGLQFDYVSVQDILILEDMYFKNLRLKEVDYRDLELTSTSVQYINSDRLEPPRT